MNKKPTVTIGIPAYNEEANIGNLLRSLLKQKQDNFILKEIIVISDGSTDQTVKLAGKILSKKIVIDVYKKREGKTKRLNEIVKKFDSDVLVLLDADILPNGNTFIKELIFPLLGDSNVGIVSCKRVPLSPRNLLEKILNYSVSFKLNMFEKWNKGANLYMCFGAARAFSRNFAKKMYWPNTISEDVYSYLFCRREEFKFRYTRKASVSYRSPNTFIGHLKQSRRYKRGRVRMCDFFPKNFVNSEYGLPIYIVISSSMKFFFKNPPLFMGYIIVLLMTRVFKHKSELNYKWSMSSSSKYLAKK